MSRSEHHPGNVTVVAVVAVVFGAFDIAAGIYFYLHLGMAAKRPGWAPYVAATIPIVVGVPSIVIGFLLDRGSVVARNVVSALMVIRVALAVILVLTTHFQTRWVTASALYAATAVIVLIMLWNRDAREFFDRSAQRAG